MSVIVVANPKGGVGKSTLASQVAGFLAHRGHAVMLGDIDRQQSAARWLAQRPSGLAPIRGWDADGEQLRSPKGVTHAVLDTPAGLRGKKLAQVLKVADGLLLPLQASLFDIQATHDFLAELHDAMQERGRRPRIALVGMRVREGTLAQQQLQQFIRQRGLAMPAELRDTQNYVQLAARGLTLWDIAPGRVARDLAQWEPLCRWLDELD
ncbi:ParA family protein [Pelomonas sp. CA6]|uniref:ParA family protein n=1 Tax=Pelomonas sp. CA6 TaxID=2907999 RepID=UPI001F4C19AC|nr:ParA family protein [Pelomonas sp. CA6]MCH7344011.1 ParA family protein [Pelomonas sp. CA6]